MQRQQCPIHSRKKLRILYNQVIFRYWCLYYCIVITFNCHFSTKVTCGISTAGKHLWIIRIKCINLNSPENFYLKCKKINKVFFLGSISSSLLELESKLEFDIIETNLKKFKKFRKKKSYSESSSHGSGTRFWFNLSEKSFSIVDTSRLSVLSSTSVRISLRLLSSMRFISWYHNKSN